MPLLPFPTTETTLGNGLRVIVVETGFPDIVSLQIPVQTGSRNEVEPGKTGFAHFFEHMMFRGTDRYPPDAYQRILTRAGARQNAFTSDDFTNYHTTFSRDDLERVLEIEADRFQNLNYSEEDFRTEARAVLGEYNKNAADPTEKLFEVMRDHAYTTHTYKHTVMGFLHDIEDMPNQYAYSRAFFDRWYRPGYTTLIIAGDVTPDAAVPLVEKYWGAWQPGHYTASIPREPEPSASVAAHVPWDTPTLPWITVAFHGPPFRATDHASAAADLLVDLWFGRTSTLYRQLVEQEQLADQLFAFNPQSVDPGLITIGARVKRMDDLVPVRDAILLAAARARDSLVSARRLDHAKTHLRYAFLRELDNTEAIAAAIAHFVHYERTTETLEELFHTRSRVTPRDLRDVARTFLTNERLVMTTLSHDALPDAMRTRPSLPEPRPRRSTRGATAGIVVQRTLLPQLEIRLLFTVGSAHDPAGREGLAALAAAMIADAGSRDLRIAEIREALHPLAATIDRQVDREMTTFILRAHRDTWARCFDVVLPMLTTPGLREEDFARLLDAQRHALLEDLRANNEEELGKERLQADVFAATPYGHPPHGTAAGLDAISLEDVRAFIAAQFTRANLTVGAAGNLPAALLTRLRGEMAAFPAGTVTAAPVVRVARHRGLRVEIIRKDTRSTAISLGHPIDVTRAHPDFPALWLARAWLGEHRSSVSHLYQRIREIRGMNYGDYAYIEAFPGGMFQFFPDPNRARHHQLFEIWLRPVLPEHAHMALRIAIHELRALIANGLDAGAFESTREYLIKSTPLLTASQSDRLGYELDARWHGTPAFTEWMRGGLAALTPDAVNDAIRRHLSGTDLDVVIVTRDAEALRDALVSDAISTVTYDSPMPAALLEEDRAIGVLPLAIAPEHVRITDVDAVFAS